MNGINKVWLIAKSTQVDWSFLQQPVINNKKNPIPVPKPNPKPTPNNLTVTPIDSKLITLILIKNEKATLKMM